MLHNYILELYYFIMGDVFNHIELAKTKFQFYYNLLKETYQPIAILKVTCNDQDITKQYVANPETIVISYPNNNI